MKKLLISGAAFVLGCGVCEALKAKGADKAITELVEMTEEEFREFKEKFKTKKEAEKILNKHNISIW